MDNCLLFFTRELPCWDEETMSLTGEDPGALSALAKAGALARLAGGYVLTQQGVKARERVGEELYVPAPPLGTPLTDADLAADLLERNRLVQLMDRAFVSDWGVKELCAGETFPIVPCLPDDEYFELKDGHVRALWPDAPIVKSFMEAFPHWGVAARQFPAPGQAGLDRWAEATGASQGELTFDLVIRAYHDFSHYSKYQPPVSDRFHFSSVNGPICVQKLRGRPEMILPMLGKLHVFLMEQRRIYVPGEFDITIDYQNSWTLLVLATDTEAELAELTTTLRGWGRDLIEPANPMYIVGTSIERLRAQKEPKRMDTDWFQEETVRILRPDFQDGE